MNGSTGLTRGVPLPRIVATRTHAWFQQPFPAKLGQARLTAFYR
jgi:hypothetical protein